MSVPSASRAQLAVAYAIVCVVWGSTYLAIRVAVDAFPPFLVAAIRFLVAGGVLFAFLRARGERAPSLAEWRGAAITGALFFVVGNALINVAERTVSSGLASVLVATMPLWTTALAPFAGERPTRGEWSGIALGLAGVVVMNLGSDLRASGVGTACALVAPMGFAAGSVASKRLVLPRGPMATAAQMLAGGVSLAVISVAAGERVPASPPARAIVALAYLAIAGSLVAFSAYAFLLRHTRAAVASSYAYVNPVVAVFLGIAFAGEHMDRTTAIGAAIVLGAVLLVTGGKARAARARGAVTAASST